MIYDDATSLILLLHKNDNGKMCDHSISERNPDKFEEIIICR